MQVLAKISFGMLICFCMMIRIHAQDIPFFSHRELAQVENPAWGFQSKYTSLVAVHRSQWEDIGPHFSTFFLNHPLGYNKKNLRFENIGAALTYEDYTFITRTSLRISSSTYLISNRNFSVKAGIDGSLVTTGLNVAEFGVVELIDPALAEVNQSISGGGAFGLFFQNQDFEVGVASLHSSFSEKLLINGRFSYNKPIISQKYKLNPLLVLRTNSNQQIQVEFQLRLDSKRFSLTSGYRQSFGYLFQLGFRLDRFRVSYGTDVPTKSVSNLGFTQEVLLAANFETKASRTFSTDSLAKVERNAMYRARLDSIRKNQADQLEILPQSEKDETSSIGRVSEKEVILFDDIPKPEDVADHTRVILGHIGFEEDSYIIKPYAYDELEKLALYLLNDMRHRIIIEGHTDDIGSDEDNVKLSKMRARAVFSFLVSQGVSENRISVLGLGEAAPLVSNDSEENRAINRRIEIIFEEYK